MKPVAWKISNRMDRQDAASIAHTYLNLSRCPGGRLMVSGLICPHCGMDTSDGDCAGTRSPRKPRDFGAPFEVQ